MVFDYLCNYPQYYKNVADWMFNQWSYLYKDSKKEEWLKNIIKRSNKNSIPEIIICEINSKLVGTASIVQCDMDTHKHLTPWLASVYVAEEERVVTYRLDEKKIQSVYSEESNQGLEQQIKLTQDLLSKNDFEQIKHFFTPVESTTLFS